jgi:hypothetical protein
VAQGGVLSAAAWFAARTEAGPAALRRRATEWLADAPALPDPALQLAAAADRALAAALARGEGRSAALDLLAADALVTLALLSRAETAPAGLAAFAESLVSTAQRP